jgi:hypothetical protein
MALLAPSYTATGNALPAPEHANTAAGCSTGLWNTDSAADEGAGVEQQGQFPLILLISEPQPGHLTHLLAAMQQAAHSPSKELPLPVKHLQEAALSTIQGWLLEFRAGYMSFLRAQGYSGLQVNTAAVTAVGCHPMQRIDGHCQTVSNTVTAAGDIPTMFDTVWQCPSHIQQLLTEQLLFTCYSLYIAGAHGAVARSGIGAA